MVADPGGNIRHLDARMAPILVAEVAGHTSLDALMHGQLEQHPCGAAIPAIARAWTGITTASHANRGLGMPKLWPHPLDPEPSPRPKWKERVEVAIIAIPLLYGYVAMLWAAGRAVWHWIVAWL